MPAWNSRANSTGTGSGRSDECRDLAQDGVVRGDGRADEDQRPHPLGTQLRDAAGHEGAHGVPDQGYRAEDAAAFLDTLAAVSKARSRESTTHTSSVHRLVSQARMVISHSMVGARARSRLL